MTIETAIAIAATAHAGAVDKGGAPYILHPLAVMRLMDTEEEQVVAVLHDAIEDSSLSLEDLLKEGLEEERMEALSLLTRAKGVSYGDYIKAIAKNPLACKVKMADLLHNMDLGRIKEPTPADYERVARYEKSLAFLRNHGTL